MKREELSDMKTYLFWGHLVSIINITLIYVFYQLWVPSKVPKVLWSLTLSKCSINELKWAKRMLKILRAFLRQMRQRCWSIKWHPKWPKHSSSCELASPRANTQGMGLFFHFSLFCHWLPPLLSHGLLSSQCSHLEIRGQEWAHLPDGSGVSGIPCPPSGPTPAALVEACLCQWAWPLVGRTPLALTSLTALGSASVFPSEE